ncbi:MAG: hypothetical protein NC548_29630 [Lachnospiraceae bacterium]|nr:hypothetical protein [Lachnospiraceae bacterium]
MNIQEYIDNPMGKGDASMMNRRLVKESMTLKFHQYTDKKGKLIKVHSYVTTKGEYYIHLVLPTETERDNTYDVVFHFYDPEKKFVSTKSIRDYEVQMFSNDPSFGYTFAYVYNQHGMLIEPLITKLGKVFITKPPDVRNKYQVVNYNKYIFYGAMYLLEQQCLTRVYLTTHATTYAPMILNRNVRTLQIIMQEYDKSERQLRKEKRYAATQERKASKKVTAKQPKEAKASGVSKVPKRKGTKNTVNSVGKIKKK